MDWLRLRTQASPDKVALIIRSQQWTFAELDELADRSVAALESAGVQSGDFVAGLLSNSLEYVCLVHGLARLGAVLVPLNTRLTASELVWQLNHTRCGWLVHDDAWISKANEIADSGCIAKMIGQGGLTTIPSSAPRVSRGSHAFDLDTTQSIIFTSGTSGHPKGATLTFANHFWSATASAFRLGTRSNDSWLSCLPLYHVGGLAVIFRSCLYGTTVVLHDKFHVDEIIQTLDEQDITLISLVPTMLYRLLDARPASAWRDSVLLVLLGGAAASADLIERCKQLHIRVATTYGLTEAASQVCTMLPEDVIRKPGSVGKPLMFTSVRIADDDGRTVPPGVYGEVVVSGPTIMQGYFAGEEANARALRQGELYTGDIGYLDDDGDLWLVQRRSDIIVTGGENVYPAEVERILRQHPAVMSACVVGIHSPEWGQQVSAMVVRREGISLSEEELIQFGREKLAGYKLPRRVLFVDQLPQTASGKIHRQAVAEQMASKPVA